MLQLMKVMCLCIGGGLFIYYVGKMLMAVKGVFCALKEYFQHS